MTRTPLFTALPLLATLFTLGGCATHIGSPEPDEKATLMPRSISYKELISLPKPKGKIVAAVYDFRDQKIGRAHV